MRGLGAGIVGLWFLAWAVAIGCAMLDQPWLGALALLLVFAATAAVFLVLLFRFPGRRPAGAEAGRPEARPLPPRADVAHGSTAPPAAGGRALPRPSNGRYPWPDAGLIGEDFDRLRARGMGRTRKGIS